MSAPSRACVPPILCYHKIDTRFELGFTQIEPRTFRRQMETLARRGYRSLGSAELSARLGAPDEHRPASAAAVAPPAGSRPDSSAAAPAANGGAEVVLTFDDGYASLARHAFPVLADLGFRALVFVITDFVGGDNTWDVQYGWRRFTHLDWDALGAWREQGIEVHSHGATHARLTWISDGEAGDELARSREEIGRRLGVAPTGVSYPFGSADERVRRLAREAGYTLGFAGPSARGADPLGLPRCPVYGWDRFALPLVMGVSRWSPVGTALARLANRCAVGTAAIQRLLGRRYTG